MFALYNSTARNDNTEVKCFPIESRQSERTESHIPRWCYQPGKNLDFDAQTSNSLFSGQGSLLAAFRAETNQRGIILSDNFQIFLDRKKYTGNLKIFFLLNLNWNAKGLKIFLDWWQSGNWTTTFSARCYKLLDFDFDAQFSEFRQNLKWFKIDPTLRNYLEFIFF